MNLQLSLKKQWFEITKSGIKAEDYRNITPYWANRLLLYNGKGKSKLWWQKEFFEVDGRDCEITEIVDNINLFCTFKKFTHNIMTLGYPKSTDTERILKLEHRGIYIGYGNPEWGAEPNKLYFIIKHGKII